MSEIVITEPVVIPTKPTEKGLIGFASCLFADSLSLNSIAIYTRPDGNGYRLVYPAKTLPNGKLINIFYPINKETAEAIDKAIFKKYDEILAKSAD